MLKALVNIFSYIFHPIVMPTIGVVAYFYLTKDFLEINEIKRVLFQIGMMTFFLPIAIYLFLRSIGVLKSGIMIRSLKERLIPIFINIALLQILVFKVMANQDLFGIKMYLITLSISYILMFILSLLRRKYSIHMMNFTAIVPLIIVPSLSMHFFSLEIMAILVFLGGALASARLSNNSHNIGDIFGGSIIGLLPHLIAHLQIFYQS